MNATQLNDYIGKVGLLSSAGLQVSVVVTDAKHAYGRLLLRVRPNDSRPNLGLIWVNASRVVLEDSHVSGRS